MNALERSALRSEYVSPVIRDAVLYYKWLSYKPQILIDRINYLRNKENLNCKERKILFSYAEEEYVLVELENYILKKEYNHDDVTRYISSHSLKSIILSRLTKEDIQIAHNNDFNPS